MLCGYWIIYPSNDAVMQILLFPFFLDEEIKVQRVKIRFKELNSGHTAIKVQVFLITKHIPNQ